MKKVLTILICCYLFAGCISSKQRYSESVHNWKGKHVNQLIDSMGYPDETTTSPMGNKLLIYHDSKTVVKEHLQYDRTRPKNMKFYTVPYTSTQHRKTFFEINEDGIILNSNWR